MAESTRLQVQHTKADAIAEQLLKLVWRLERVQYACVNETQHQFYRSVGLALDEQRQRLLHDRP